MKSDKQFSNQGNSLGQARSASQEQMSTPDFLLNNLSEQGFDADSVAQIMDSLPPGQIVRYFAQNGLDALFPELEETPSEDSYGQDATALELGSALDATIESGMESDLYSIELEEGVNYSFNVTSDELSSPYLVLRDSDGERISSDFQEGDETSATFSFTAPQSGTFYLDLSDLDDQASGTYNISVAEVEASTEDGSDADAGDDTTTEDGSDAETGDDTTAEDGSDAETGDDTTAEDGSDVDTGDDTEAEDDSTNQDGSEVISGEESDTEDTSDTEEEAPATEEESDVEEDNTSNQDGSEVIAGEGSDSDDNTEVEEGSDVVVDETTDTEENAEPEETASEAEESDPTSEDDSTNQDAADVIVDENTETEESTETEDDTTNQDAAEVVTEDNTDAEPTDETVAEGEPEVNDEAAAEDETTTDDTLVAETGEDTVIEDSADVDVNEEATADEDSEAQVSEETAAEDNVETTDEIVAAEDTVVEADEDAIVIELPELYESDLSADILTTSFLAVSNTAESSLDFAGDEDWFATSFAAGSTYDVSLESETLEGGNLAIYDAEGELALALSSEDEDGVLSFTAEESGTYFIGVADANAEATGDYLVGVQQQMPEDFIA
ncbi:hypothetical protein [Marinomonas fungiae]|uniref:hypothetical protein n=1 Tax=Marinomonas fungiae TaxID=1137284 RepID=UPI003A948574